MSCVQITASWLKQWERTFLTQAVLNLILISKTRPGVTKEVWMQCCSKGRCSNLVGTSSQQQKQKSQFPLLGMALLCISPATWGRVPRKLNSNYLPPPQSSSFLMTDWWPPQVPPECNPRQGTATLNSRNWFPLGPCVGRACGGDFHYWPPLDPLPLRNYSPLGNLLC